MKPKSSKKNGPFSSGYQNWNAFYALHPYDEIVFPTDKYYAGIAQRILPMLVKMRTSLNCEQEVAMRIALSLAAYFEDQVSKLGLWSAFTHRYHELYGKWLPWYDTTSESADYYEDEVNLQDVKFLIWIIFVSTQGQYLVSPDHPAIEISAKRVFDLLMEEFESAPANEALVEMVYDEGITKNYASLKTILRWMARTCYLMAVPSWQTEIRIGMMNMLVDGSYLEVPFDDASYMASSYAAVRMRFGPLALYPKEWFVLMRKYKGIEKDNDKILDIRSTPFYPFRVLGNDGKTIHLMSCRGNQYRVDLKSFLDDQGNQFKMGDMLMTSLVRYKNKWVINGLAAGISLEGKDPMSRASMIRFAKMGADLMEDGVAFDLFHLPDPDFKYKLELPDRKRLDIALTENGGKRLFYFPNSASAMKWIEHILGEKDQSAQNDMAKYIGDGPLMIYVGKDYRMMTSKYVYTINDPENPYFDPERAYEGVDILYNIFGVPNEFIAYLVEHNYLTNFGFTPKDKDPNDWNLIKENYQFYTSFIRQYPC